MFWSWKEKKILVLTYKLIEPKPNLKPQEKHAYINDTDVNAIWPETNVTQNQWNVTTHMDVGSIPLFRDAVRFHRSSRDSSRVQNANMTSLVMFSPCSIQDARFCSHKKTPTL